MKCKYKKIPHDTQHITFKLMEEGKSLRRIYSAGSFLEKICSSWNELPGYEVIMIFNLRHLLQVQHALSACKAKYD